MNVSRPVGKLTSKIRTRPKVWTRTVLPVLIILLSLVGTGLMFMTKPVLPPIEPEEKVWTIAVTPAVRSDVRPELRVFGEIVSQREVVLRPLVAGRVIEVGENFRNGGIVAAGDLLIAIDPFDYELVVEERRAELIEAQARLDELVSELAAERRMLSTDRQQLALRERELERQQTLFNKGTGTQKALDEAQIERNQARQQVIGAEQTTEMLAARETQQQATIARAEAALRRAERELEDTRLIAPFDGFLSDTDIAIGKQVSIGDSVATLFDATSLEAKFHLSDRQYARVLESEGVANRPAQVIWWIGETPHIFDALVDRVEGQVDATSGGVDLYASIVDIGSTTILRPGVFVEVRVPDRLYTGVYDLPAPALHDGNVVYVVGDNNRLQAKHVDLRLRHQDRVLVEGALDGMRVVTSKFAEIGPGILVQIVE